MQLKLFMVNVIVGPVILKSFILPKNEIEDYFMAKNFIFFSSYSELDFFTEILEKDNYEYSYLITDITSNVKQDSLKCFFDQKMKNSAELLRIFEKFKTPIFVSKVEIKEEEKQQRLDIILDKIHSKGGVSSLNEEEKSFLQKFN